MGNIPAKITGKYQSYDINTPSHVTSSLSVRKHDSLERKIESGDTQNDYESKLQQNIDILDEEKQQGFHETFHESSIRNSVYNEQPVDVSSDYRADTSENEDYIEHHVNHMENNQRQIDVMY